MLDLGLVFYTRIGSTSVTDRTRGMNWIGKDLLVKLAYDTLLDRRSEDRGDDVLRQLVHQMRDPPVLVEAHGVRAQRYQGWTVASQVALDGRSQNEAVQLGSVRQIVGAQFQTVTDDNPRLVLVGAGLELADSLGISGILDGIPLSPFSFALGFSAGITYQGASVIRERCRNARGTAHQRQQEHPAEQRRHLKMMVNQYPQVDVELRVPDADARRHRAGVPCTARKEFLQFDRDPAHVSDGVSLRELRTVIPSVTAVCRMNEDRGSQNGFVAF